MTPILALAPHSRLSGPASGSGLAIIVESAPQSVRRAQPVEKIHAPMFRTQGQPALHSRIRRAEQALTLLPEAPQKRAPGKSTERLSPFAKFGNSAPAMAQIMAHESGYLRIFMPAEMSAFSRQSPTDAYQATLDRSRLFMMDHPPLRAAA